MTHELRTGMKKPPYYNSVRISVHSFPSLLQYREANAITSKRSEYMNEFARELHERNVFSFPPQLRV